MSINLSEVSKGTIIVKNGVKCVVLEEAVKLWSEANMIITYLLWTPEGKGDEGFFIKPSDWDQEDPIEGDLSYDNIWLAPSSPIYVDSGSQGWELGGCLTKEAVERFNKKIGENLFFSTPFKEEGVLEISVAKTLI